VHRQRYAQQFVALARWAAVPGEDLGAESVAPVQPDRATGGAHHLGDPGQQPGGELGQRLVGVRVGGELHQVAHGFGARRTVAVPVRFGDAQRAGRRPGGPAGAGPVQAEPDALAGGQVGRAPPAGEVVDEQQPAPSGGHLGDVGRGVAHTDDQLVDRAGGEVGDGHGEAGAVGVDLDVQFGTRVFDGVGGQLGGEQQRLVEQFGQPRFEQHGAHQRAGRRGGAAVGGEADPADALVRAAAGRPCLR